MNQKSENILIKVLAIIVIIFIVISLIPFLIVGGIIYLLALFFITFKKEGNGYFRFS
jgi:hypothetical protein